MAGGFPVQRARKHNMLDSPWVVYRDHPIDLKRCRSYFAYPPAQGWHAQLEKSHIVRSSIYSRFGSGAARPAEAACLAQGRGRGLWARAGANVACAPLRRPPLDGGPTSGRPAPAVGEGARSTRPRGGSAVAAAAALGAAPRAAAAGADGRIGVGRGDGVVPHGPRLVDAAEHCSADVQRLALCKSVAQSQGRRTSVA